MQPPYYAVIFTSTRTPEDNGYGEMAAQMEALAKEDPGFLGIESAREDLGITVSYWKDVEAIKRWKAHMDHKVAQEKGRTLWYSQYTVRICRVERAYNFETSGDSK